MKWSDKIKNMDGEMFCASCGDEIGNNKAGDNYYTCVMCGEDHCGECFGQGEICLDCEEIMDTEEE